MNWLTGITGKGTGKSPASFQLNELQLVLATQAAFLAYIIYSFVSTGFYQHDEVGHFLSMQRFWHDPNAILGSWQKPGYKLLYVVPSLLGKGGVTAMNALLASLTGYFTYKSARLSGARAPLIAFILLVSQPLWFEMAFRNYSEIPTAFLLILGIWFHQKEKPLVAALILSYCTMIRQEFFVLLAVYGIYLLYRRQVWPVLMLPVFPLINNLWGYFATGDWLYLLNSVIRTSSSYQEAYVRHGFDHYFLMSMTIFGALALTFFVGYLAVCLVKKKEPDWLYLVPFLLYFLLHSLFNMKSFVIGPSTGGNLRYMIVLAPLMAVMGNLGVERILKMEDRRTLLFILVPFVVAVGLYMSYEHTYVTLTSERDWVPPILTLVAAGGVFLLKNVRTATWFTLAAGVLVCALSLNPLELSREDKLMNFVAKWTRERGIEGRHVLVQHPMYLYFYGKSRHDFEHGAGRVTKEQIENAPEGTVIIWDNHYSYRKGQESRYVLPSYFFERPDTYKLVKQFFVNDRSFDVYIFEKTSS